MGTALAWLIETIIGLMIWFIIAQAILSWLVAFDVVNYRNRFVYSVGTFLDRVTAPLLEPFRRIIPNLGGIDISPIVVILLLQFIRIAFVATAKPALIQLLG
ncbi:YggT family protein [Brevundimonas vesicularis]|uniref:YggT family protein n=1 Tax=Brevundimonas vesicularis TaxID=41276 RepID=UPI0022ABF40F|nr:YggT family protein [Brevundimonas vesicularis]